MTLYLGMDNELLIVNLACPEKAVAVLIGARITSLAVDQRDQNRVYCGTNNLGLLGSVDAGATWNPVGAESFRSVHVLSVAVSPVDPSIVFAGTEPSALYRSDDGGDTWRELTSLQDVPSKPAWSFPPRPETHHLRWITPHPTDVGQLFVAIEAGALLRSSDGGETWQDRVLGGPIDSHTVCIRPDRPDRVLSAAGDGFFESDDRGNTWQKRENGLPWRYCYGLAIDPSDSPAVVMSVSPGAHRGHGDRYRAQAAIVRTEGNGRWHVVSDGLPDPEGTSLSVFATDPAQPGRFYALNNTGVYRSNDAAVTWQRLDVPWKEDYLDRRPPAIALGHP